MDSPLGAPGGLGGSLVVQLRIEKVRSLLLPRLQDPYTSVLSQPVQLMIAASFIDEPRCDNCSCSTEAASILVRTAGD
jgi:hypothetical protein